MAAAAGRLVLGWADRILFRQMRAGQGQILLWSRPLETTCTAPVGVINQNDGSGWDQSLIESCHNCSCLHCPLRFAALRCRTVHCACESSPSFCFASVFSLFGEEKRSRPLRSGFLQSRGGLHSLSRWLWEFSDIAVGKCL